MASRTGPGTMAPRPSAPCPGRAPAGRPATRGATWAWTAGGPQCGDVVARAGAGRRLPSLLQVEHEGLAPKQAQADGDEDRVHEGDDPHRLPQPCHGGVRVNDMQQEW